MFIESSLGVTKHITLKELKWANNILKQVALVNKMYTKKVAWMDKIYTTKSSLGGQNILYKK